MNSPSAEIIAIGSEFLHGGRVETNSLWLADALAECGIRVGFKTIVGDVEPDIMTAISQSVHRADVVILTGGLGPTRDDVTRQAVAKCIRQSLRRHPQAARSIQIWCTSRNRKPTSAQFRQASIPRGAQVLNNLAGSAPGFYLTWKGRMLFALPGVPREAEKMFFSELLPILKEHKSCDSSFFRRMVHIYGLTESEVEEKISFLYRKFPEIQVGLLASPLGVSVSLSRWRSSGRNPTLLSIRLVSQQIDQGIVRMREVLEDSIFGEGQETMEEVVGGLLRQCGFTLSLAESCTGGLIGHRLTQVSGSSQYLERGVICYSNQSKIDLLGVSKNILLAYGAVSCQVAAAMAKGVRLRSKSHVGLSVTGIAGPDGGSPEKPVGLVYVGLSAHGFHSTQEFRFYGDRKAIKLRASQGALDCLRRWLVQGRKASR